MVNDILTSIGLQNRRGRFVRAPGGTYAVYLDDVSAEGPDILPGMLRRHDVTVELYEPAPDDKTEEDLETVLDAAGLRWTKQDRYWIHSEQLYQVVYDFSYHTKGGK